MLRPIRALLVFWSLPWVAGAAGCINRLVPSMPVDPDQPAAEPTAEMTGEQ